MRQKKTSHVRLWILCIVLLLAISWLFTRKFFFAPVDLEEWDIVQGTTFSLWQEIALVWEIKADWDIVTHTHTINDPVYWVMKIKSDIINLWEYAWVVELTWIIEKFYQGTPIIKVNELSWMVADSEDIETDIVLDDNSWVYILWAWIQFLPEFFDEYVLLNEWENGEILIQDVESWDEIAIDYFRCNSSDPNRNCKWLNDTFANTSAQSFVTSNGDTYYKQSEVQSRFVSNGDRWGMFINDVPDDTIMKLKDVMVFANEKVMKNRLNFSAMRICQWSWEKLQKITDSNITLKQEGLIANISWDWLEKQIACQILVDFSLPAKWVLQSITIWDDNVAEEINNQEENDKLIENDNNIQDTSSNDVILTWDPNVVQFPIKTEWGLTYSSSRWGYSLQFPSSNISYAVSSVSETFNQPNLSCSYVINVIKYSERENLEISPAIRIYECSSKWSVTSRAENYVVKYALDKVFVVQINDSSWIEFANNLQFKTLEDVVL